MIDEFIDAYSDDQIYLEMIEKLVNDHTSESLVPDGIKYSSFCRLWVVMMVGSVEMMIKKWAKPEIMMADIAAYFEKKPNEEKISKLYKAFELRGLEPKKECFDDFLACKYIRNAYVHGEWDEEQRVFVESMGFPSTTMKFSPEHYARIKECYYHLLNNLGMANAFNTVVKQKLDV
ncbi:hypothetical protein [Aeromonas caviae]|uniref:hypothetical protein n=1 Tax=Aeromonas caviae TaxID=648 RepID=UPI002B482D8E|nr:hypothetical protein [Aeromonas caviae]